MPTDDDHLHDWLCKFANIFELVISLTEQFEEYQIKDLDLKECVRSLFADSFREFVT